MATLWTDLLQKRTLLIKHKTIFKRSQSNFEQNDKICSMNKDTA